MSKESLKKAVEALKAAMDDFMKAPYVSMRLHISKGNRKIGQTHNFSIAPVLTCANCSRCKHYCYDLKAVLQYPNVLKARAENTAMMLQDMDGTFAQIDNYISRQKAHKYFRWHVSGDILSVEYFDHMVRIARKHPDWVFWTYTKAYTYVNTWLHDNGRDSLPKNLSVMFSVWNGMACPNPFGMPTFTCIMEGMEPENGSWPCPGNCESCLRSGHGCPFGESSHVPLH